MVMLLFFVCVYIPHLHKMLHETQDNRLLLLLLLNHINIFRGQNKPLEKVRVLAPSVEEAIPEQVASPDIATV